MPFAQAVANCAYNTIKRPQAGGKYREFKRDTRALKFLKRKKVAGELTVDFNTICSERSSGIVYNAGLRRLVEKNHTLLV